MSTATDEAVEVDVNLDEAVPCDGFDGFDGCDRSATWRGTPSPCLHGVLLCGPHKRAAEAFLTLSGENLCNVGAEPHRMNTVTWRKL